MRRLTLLVLPFAAALAFLAAAANAASSSPAGLVGTVGPAFKISLARNGKPVTTIAPGRYSLTIHDRSAIHSFSMTGPGGYKQAFTTVPFIGTKTFTITLKTGAYRYFCPPHASFMFGDFKVT